MAIVQKMGDVVYLCGYEEEDSKTKHIAKDVIQNVAGGTLHGKVIGKQYVSLTITESYEDDYPLLEPLDGDDPPVETIGQAKGSFILWSTECVTLCPKKMEKEGAKEVVDKRRGDKPPVVTKAAKKTKPTHELVSTCYGACSIQ